MTLIIIIKYYENSVIINNEFIYKDNIRYLLNVFHTRPGHIKKYVITKQ